MENLRGLIIFPFFVFFLLFLNSAIAGDWDPRGKCVAGYCQPAELISGAYINTEVWCGQRDYLNDMNIKKSCTDALCCECCNDLDCGVIGMCCEGACNYGEGYAVYTYGVSGESYDSCLDLGDIYVEFIDPSTLPSSWGGCTKGEANNSRCYGEQVCDPNSCDCVECSHYDGCYAYGSGCEERNYYYSGGDCTYSYSNRHTDSWVGSKWCEDPYWWYQRWRNYYCSGNTCAYYDTVKLVSAGTYCSGGYPGGGGT